MNKQSKLISCEDLKKNYETPAGNLQILKGIDFSLNHGEMAFLIGRSGSGKSTLLHLLGGLDVPNAGRILFEGKDMTEMSERELAKIRNTRIGFVFQSYHLLPELTLLENVMLPMMISGKKDKNWAKEILKKVRLINRQDHYPSELSGGEQQRAAIARSLVNHPALVLCDEPTGNLDSETAESVLSLIHELNQREGNSFVIVTHDENIAWRYEQVYRLTDGLLVREERGKLSKAEKKSI